MNSKAVSFWAMCISVVGVFCLNPRVTSGQEFGDTPVDRIAAVVGSEIILYSDVLARAVPMMQQFKQQSGVMSAERERDVLMAALDEMINDKLVEAVASEMRITVTIEEVDRAIENVARENGLDSASFRKAVVAQGMDFAAYRASLKGQLLRYKVLNLRVRGRVNVTEEDARRFYNDQVREVRSMSSFEGAHILIRVPRGAKASDVAAARKRALDLMGRLDSDERFGDLAREFSEDTATAKFGGSLGERRHGVVPEVLDRAFLDMEDGETVGPIRSAAGFHILLMVQREKLGVQLFSGVKNRIIGQLTEQEMLRQQRIWLSELRRDTFIDIRL